jgi:hypothetical protein
MSNGFRNAAIAGLFVVATALGAASASPAFARGDNGQGGPGANGGNGDGNAPVAILDRVPPRQGHRVERDDNHCVRTLFGLMSGAPRCPVDEGR